MKLNIRQRLIFFTCLLISVTGVITYYYAEHRVKQTVTEQIERKLSTSSYYFMNSLDVYMYERMQDIRSIAHESVLRSDTVQYSHSYFYDLLQNNEAYDALYLFDDEHKSLAKTTSVSHNTKTQLDRLWSKLLLEDLVMDYIFDDEGTIQKLLIAFRFDSQLGSRYLVGTIPLTNIYQLIKDDFEYLNIKEKFDLELFDQNGTVLYTNRKSRPGDIMSSIKLKKIINLIYNPKNTFSNEFYVDSSEVYFISEEKGYHEFKGNGWFLILSIPSHEAYLPVIHLNQSILTIFSIIGLFAAIAVVIMSRYFTMPLMKLNQLSLAYAEGDFNRTLLLKGKDEFSQLANQMMSMATQLQIKMKQKNHLNNTLQNKLQLVREQKIEIEKTKKQLESGLRYAERIQKALLPGPKKRAKLAFDVDVYFKPLQSVSGDYYFIEEFQLGKESFFVAAVVDCTGHGVPGAFMTFIAHHLLVYLVNIKKLTDPAHILRELDYGVKQNLKQDGGEGLNDGMELSLVVINKSTWTLQFASAKRPLLICNKQVWTEVPGTKRCICGNDCRDVEGAFDSVSFNLHLGDQIVMFTDGVSDQFGGSKGKKLGKRRLKEWCFSKPEGIAFNEITTAVEQWQGNTEQIDDMTLMSIRV